MIVQDAVLLAETVSVCVCANANGPFPHWAVHRNKENALSVLRVASSSLFHSYSLTIGSSRQLFIIIRLMSLFWWHVRAALYQMQSPPSPTVVKLAVCNVPVHCRCALNTNAAVNRHKLTQESSGALFPLNQAIEWFVEGCQIAKGLYHQTTEIEDIPAVWCPVCSLLLFAPPGSEPKVAAVTLAYAPAADQIKIFSACWLLLIRVALQFLQCHFRFGERKWQNLSGRPEKTGGKDSCTMAVQRRNPLRHIQNWPSIRVTFCEIKRKRENKIQNTHTYVHKQT